jgi:twitching motility protein PilI
MRKSAQRTSGDRKHPFQVLKEYERLSLAHAVGLPEQIEVTGQFTGIGFSLGGINLVASIEDIREILPFPNLTKVPGAAEWLLGIANVRGTLAAVIDLRGFLEGDETEITPRSRLLLVNQGSGAVGLLVDEVMGLRRFLDEETAEDAQLVSSMVAGYIAREYEQDGVRWGVFDLDELLQRPRFAQAAA